VLVSAFATRGLCADVVRAVLTEHDLLVGEVVLGELREVLTKRIRVPRKTVEAIEELLREQVVIPKPKRPADIDVRDTSDRWILASAIEGSRYHRDRRLRPTRAGTEGSGGAPQDVGRAGDDWLTHGKYVTPLMPDPSSGI
jgi:hypothetical protein